MIAFKTFCTESQNVNLNMFVTILTIIILFVYPQLTVYIVKRANKKLNNEKVRASIGTLYILQDTEKI